MTSRERTTIARPAHRAGRDDGTRPVPRRLLFGLALIATWWALAWLQIRPISDYYFTPLWIGYILSVDGLVALRTGASPIARHGRLVVFQFIVSVGLWWIFEGFNEIVRNWHYLTPRDYSALEYAALASISFSTVIPAVLTTAELVRSFNVHPPRWLPALRQTPRFLLTAHLAGWAMLAAIVAAPTVAFPLVWLSTIFLLDPLVTLLGGQSIGRYLERRDWSPVINLALGALICGWFWEMWNVYSLPKWEYTVPYVEVLHVFEMPLLGYLGYLPFGVEVFVFYQLVRVLARRVPLPEPLVSNRDVANVRGIAPIETTRNPRL